MTKSSWLSPIQHIQTYVNDDICVCVCEHKKIKGKKKTYSWPGLAYIWHLSWWMRSYVRGVRKDSNKGITSYKTKGRARGRPRQRLWLVCVQTTIIMCPPVFLGYFRDRIIIRWAAIERDLDRKEKNIPQSCCPLS